MIRNRKYNIIKQPFEKGVFLSDIEEKELNNNKEALKNSLISIDFNVSEYGGDIELIPYPDTETFDLNLTEVRFRENYTYNKYIKNPTPEKYFAALQVIFDKYLEIRDHEHVISLFESDISVQFFKTVPLNGGYVIVDILPHYTPFAGFKPLDFDIGDPNKILNRIVEELG